jgi:hypothetical protein
VRKRILILLVMGSIVAGCGGLVCAAKNQPTAPCGLNMIPFLDRNGRMDGRRPREDCYYSLQLTRVVQKVPGGYLFSLNPIYYSFPSTLAYLKTDENLSEDSTLSGDAYYYGDFSYDAVNGFKQSVFGFKRVHQR